MREIIRIIFDFGFFYFIILPIITLLHELGHALSALCFTSCNVHILLGTTKIATANNFSIRFHERLRVSIKFHVRGAPIGFCNISSCTELTSKRAIMFFSGGPIASLLMTLVFSYIAYSSEFVIWQHFASGAFFSLVFTIIPMHYPKWFGEYAGLASDGLNIWGKIHHSLS